MTFDEVLPTLLRVCEAWEHADTLLRIAVVRDLRGRVRLAVEQKDADNALLKAHRKALGEELRTALGEWFTGEVLATKVGSPAERGVAAKVIAMAPDWPAPRYPDGVGGTVTVAPNRWKLLERRVGKQPWLEGTVDVPWALQAGAPTVVTFYSFKGGVGRTTTLGACALLAAAAGEKVVVVDLDLEAPGLASMFGVTVVRGVLDFLVDHLATGAHGIEDLTARPVGLDESVADLIEVIPAGALGPGYLEKLARLDFAGSALEPGSASPVRAALGALLEEIKERINPRWILLDARAGLHDLAGLSLHGLAHLDVLFSRSNRQGFEGLALVLEAFARPTRQTATRTVLVHAMAPVGREEAASRYARLRHEAHGLFKRYLYDVNGPVPEETAEDADHRPWMIRRNENIELNDDLVDVVRSLTDSDYRELWERIRLLTGPSGGGGE